MRVILVLGAAVRPEGPSQALLRRADHAARLYHGGGVDRILASGGGSGPIPEADAIAKRLIQKGVPAQAIITEPRSRTTWENIANARTLLAQIGATTITLVTDRSHMPRALLAARRHGLTVQGSAAPPGSAPAWKRWRSALREVPALAYYALRPAPPRPR